jgi:hypothetical protein
MIDVLILEEPQTKGVTGPVHGATGNSAAPNDLPAQAGASSSPKKPKPGHADDNEKHDVVSGLTQIGGLAKRVARDFSQAMAEIERVNLQTKILSFNAQIEAARAGAIGNPFGVVAMEMVTLSEQSTTVTKQLATETQASITSLNEKIATLGQDIRGTRLTDLAMTNIDVIDRNLYERSCDVRWWATDNSVVEALTRPETRDHACKRLGVILDSYTVYFDIVLCDLNGRVVANGRREKFPSLGTSQKNEEWFQTAVRTADGTQFGFQSVHRSSTLAGGQHILVYSCGVRAGGDARGQLIGVLGIIFNWEGLGQTVVNGTLISDDEKAATRVCIVDKNGLVLADSRKKIIQETLRLPDQPKIFSGKKNFAVVQMNGEPTLVAHALSPGFETYATGWHSLILQRLELK